MASVTIVTYSSPMRMTRPSSSRPTSQMLSAMAAPTTRDDRDDDRPDRRPVDLEVDRRAVPDELGETEAGLEQHRHAEPEGDPDDDGDEDRQAVLDRGQAGRLRLGQPERPQEPELARPPLGVEQDDRDDGQRRVDERDRQRQTEASGDAGDERRVVDGRVSVVA